MKIAESALQLSAHHEATTRREIHQSFKAWSGERSATGTGRGAADASASRVSISAGGAEVAAAAQGAEEAGAVADAADAADGDPRLRLIKSLVEMLTGKEVELITGRLAAESSGKGSAAPAKSDSVALPRSAGWGIRFDYREVREETEATTFRAKGSVRTAEGRQIAFDFGLSMSRSYREEVSFSLGAGERRQKDPLVINLGGKAAQLSATRFRFDLNGDGTAEEVPMLAGDSAYLALDRNINGRVDSGRELFGPASGNGFAELAAFDEDGNGWIDESDAAFGQLWVWQPAREGDGALASLRDAGVGALSLATAVTPFELRDAGNQSLGTVRTSGVYLAENGRVGSLQQIDLTV